MGLVNRGIDAFSSSLVAKALGTAFDSGSGGAFKSRSGNTLHLHAVVSGSAPTSVNMQVHECTESTAYYPLEAINDVSGGDIDQDDGTWVCPGTVGNHRATAAISPGAQYKILAKRVGGGATTKLLVKAVVSAE